MCEAENILIKHFMPIQVMFSTIHSVFLPIRLETNTFSSPKTHPLIEATFSMFNNMALNNY
jgi:hypothetical protein